ncbi:hypothetical protein [Limnoglobus roseus]|uniref:DUF5666 domain-containing protein n=1 Tax=Limnoglobus roseus TaxID=2598579 RepID=A0A5C1A5P0_9BACT|nr:hypothetical protein [Limnoglobus roseus]QEL13637.1 hypothetical protein PX52LOC_00495 [Limnoglobus roseus]
MKAHRFAICLALFVALTSRGFAADEVIPSRTHVNDVVVELSSTAPGSVTVKTTNVVPTGRYTGSGKNRRPQVKAETKEETIDVIKDVVVKDSKAKDGKGDFSSLAAGQQVKLHISKETIRAVGMKPESKLVVTQIDVVHVPGEKAAPPAEKK